MALVVHSYRFGADEEAGAGEDEEAAGQDGGDQQVEAGHVGVELSDDEFAVEVGVVAGVAVGRDAVEAIVGVGLEERRALLLEGVHAALGVDAELSVVHDAERGFGLDDPLRAVAQGLVQRQQVHVAPHVLELLGRGHGGVEAVGGEQVVGLLAVHLLDVGAEEEDGRLLVAPVLRFAHLRDGVVVGRVHRRARRRHEPLAAEDDDVPLSHLQLGALPLAVAPVLADVLELVALALLAGEHAVQPLAALLLVALDGFHGLPAVGADEGRRDVTTAVVGVFGAVEHPRQVVALAFLAPLDERGVHVQGRAIFVRNIHTVSEVDPRAVVSHHDVNLHAGARALGEAPLRAGGPVALQLLAARRDVLRRDGRAHDGRRVEVEGQFILGRDHDDHGEVEQRHAGQDRCHLTDADTKANLFLSCHLCFLLRCQTIHQTQLTNRTFKPESGFARPHRLKSTITDTHCVCDGQQS